MLDWVEIFKKNTAAIFPKCENIYSSISYISLTYGQETWVLEF